METPHLLIFTAVGSALASFGVSWLSASVSNARALKNARFHASVSASNQAVTSAESQHDLIKRICQAGTQKTGYLRMSVINRFGYVVYDTDANQQIMDDVMAGGLQNIFNQARKDEPIILRRSFIDFFKVKNPVAVIMMPIFAHDEIQLMLCGIGKSNTFVDQQHIDLLQEFAGDIGFGIKAFELLKHKEETSQRMHLMGQLFSDSKDGIAVTDENGFVIEANRSYCEMNRTHESHIKNKIIQEFVNPEKRLAIQNRLSIDSEWNGERLLTNDKGKNFLSSIRITTVRHQGSDTQLIVTMIDQSQQLEMKQEVFFLSNHDHLTGLPNKKNFQIQVQDLLVSRIEDQTKIAFFYIEIHEFNYINDSVWDKNAEDIIKLVASKMVNHLHDSVLIGRVGDSDFMVCARVDSQAHARSIADTLLNCMALDWAIEDIQIELTPSIGVSLCPDHGETYNELAKSAQKAVKTLAKSRSKRIKFAEKEISEFGPHELMKFESELIKSISREQLELHFQPQVNLNTNQIIGYEALVRWKHHEVGLLYPDKFIDLAEKNGFIVEIGHWVIETACKQLQYWKSKNTTQLKIAVNVSPLQFYDEDLVSVIVRCIKQYGVQPGELELEITESAIMGNEVEAIELLEEIKKQGIILSIDDFGVGHSSLAYLKKLPVHKVKIDRSFVTDLPHDVHSATIVKAIMNIAAGLNMEVVAEGIETKEQEEFMKEHNCLHGQGRLYGMATREINVISGPSVLLS